MSAKTKMPSGEYTGGNVPSLDKFFVPFALAAAAAGTPLLTKGLRNAGSKASEKIKSLTSKKESTSEIKGGAGKRLPKTGKPSRQGKPPSSKSPKTPSSKPVKPKKNKEKPAKKK